MRLVAVCLLLSTSLATAAKPATATPDHALEVGRAVRDVARPLRVPLIGRRPHAHTIVSTTAGKTARAYRETTLELWPGARGGAPSLQVVEYDAFGSPALPLQELAPRVGGQRKDAALRALGERVLAVFPDATAAGIRAGVDR